MTETLKPGKKNAHVILFTHGRLNRTYIGQARALCCKYDFHIFTAIIHHLGGLTWHEEVVLAPRMPSYSGVPGEAQF